MEKFNIKKKTVVMNLYNFVKKGNDIDKASLYKHLSIDHQKTDEVISAFNELGSEYLKPVYEYFNGSIDYDDIEIVRLIFLNK